MTDDQDRDETLAAQPPVAPVETGDLAAAKSALEEIMFAYDLDEARRMAAVAFRQISVPHSSAATEGVVGLEVLRRMADLQRGVGMPPKPMVRPSGSNADEWNVFLEEYTGHGNSFIAVQIAEAIEDAEKRGTLNEPQTERRYTQDEIIAALKGAIGDLKALEIASALSRPQHSQGKDK